MIECYQVGDNMNYKIAVCDDENVICGSIFNILKKISEDISICFETDCFNTGEELCREMKRTNYDLIFLDIELPKMNGIEVGRYIRENLKNEVIQIAYISSKQDYAMELFEMRPINFLVKPLNYEKIRKIIDKFLTVSETDAHIFKFKIGREFHKILLSNILYFCSNGRKVHLIAQNEEFEFYGSLENIYSELKDSKFLFVHKSFIVNYKHIKGYEYEQITMINNAVIPISQPRRKAVRSMFIELEEGDI